MVADSPSQPLRVLFLAGVALVISLLASVAAHGMEYLIAFLTQWLFHGRFSFEWTTAVGHTRGIWVILIPALGGGLIALMARFGSTAIIGHGIPEVMQQVLVNRSRISPKVAILKPLSSVLSIGTGAPYGAEGPVIATGSALGSLFGQLLTVTSSERKILLSAGAAAAMTAIFGSPMASTLLAVELLLFEFSARSIIPVAVAAAGAQLFRLAWGKPAALYEIQAGLESLVPMSFASLVVIGFAAGLLAIAANWAVHATEAGFAKIPMHWMWRPVAGGLLVGVIGWYDPRIFGAGYNLIGGLLEGNLPLAVVAGVCMLKLLAWVLSLGSGTSGGTLAPMLIAGGGLGVMVAALCGHFPGAQLAPGLAALAGMIAFFAGGSRALFASVMLGMEITQEGGVLWPILTASVVAVATAHVLSRYSMMNSPVEHRGIRVPVEYDVDLFTRITVGQVMERKPQTIPPTLKVEELADRIGANDPTVSHHPALLVADEDGLLAGIITRRDLVAAMANGQSELTIREVMSRYPICAYPDELLREAVDRMHERDVGRLPVIDREEPGRLLGYLGRGAILSARRVHMQAQHVREPGWLAACIAPLERRRKS